MRNANVNAAIGAFATVPTSMFIELGEKATSPGLTVKMPNQRHARTLPGSLTLPGGPVGRAASGTANGRDVARADDFSAIVRCLAIVGLAIGVLAFSAPYLWPGLFAQ